MFKVGDRVIVKQVPWNLKIENWTGTIEAMPPEEYLLPQNNNIVVKLDKKTRYKLYYFPVDAISPFKDELL